METLYSLLEKKTGGLRRCIDFRALDANTRLDIFHLPMIANLLDRLDKARYFSGINLASAYH